MDSNVDLEKTNTECIQLYSLVLLYLCKVSGMLTEVQRKDTFVLFCFVLKSLKAFLKTKM